MNKKTKLKQILLELVLIRWKIKDTDKNGNTYCITCNLFTHRTNLCWWHFMPQSRGDSTRFELDNVNAQCSWCNGKSNQGEQWKHWVYIDKRYWKGRAEQLQAQSHKLRKWGMGELEQEIDIVEMFIKDRYEHQTIEQQKHLINYIKKNSSRKSKCKWLLNKLVITYK